MTIQEKVVVGKKGEIFTKKPLREAAGIKPGDEVIIEARKGELIIKKIYSVDEALNMPIINTSSPEEAEAEIQKACEFQKQLTNEEL